MKIEDLKRAFKEMEAHLQHLSESAASSTTKKTEEVVHKTLEDMDQNASILKVQQSELLKEVSIFLKENEQDWSSHTVKVFISALSSVGILKDKELINLFISMSKEGASIEKLKHFLKEFPQVINYRDENRNSALHLAIASRSVKAYEALISCEPKRSFFNKNGESIYDLLLEMDPDESDAYLYLTPPDIKTIKVNDLSGNSFLQRAIIKKHRPLFQYCLNHIDPNKTNIEGKTPLDLALSLTNGPDKTVIILALLSKGVRLNQKDRNGDFPIKIAINTASIEIIQAMLAKMKPLKASQYKKELLELAIKREEDAIFIFKSLVQFFGEKKLADKMPSSMFEEAIKVKDWSLAAHLIEAGFILIQKEAFSNKKKLFEDALQKVNQLSELKGNSKQFFNWGLKIKSLNIITKMLELGYPVQESQIDRMPLLHYLCTQKPSYRSVICISKMVEQGVDLNKRDSKERTALYYALRQKPPTLAVQLITHGANFSLEDYDFSFDITVGQSLLEQIVREESDRKTLNMPSLLSKETLQNLAQLNEFFGSTSPFFWDKTVLEATHLPAENRK